MAKIHNDTVKDLETMSEALALRKLIKKVGKEKAFEVLDQINFYYSAEELDKALRMIKAEDGAMKQLNSFFGFK